MVWNDLNWARKKHMQSIAIAILTMLVLGLPISLVYKNVILTLAIVCIGVNTGFLNLISAYTKRSFKDMIIRTDEAYTYIYKLIILNILSCIFLTLLRFSPNAQVALFWGAFLLPIYLLIPLGLLNVTLIFPEKMLSRKTRRRILIFFVFIFFFFTVPIYIYNIIYGNYNMDLERVNGIYPEIRVFEVGLGWLAPFVIIPFVGVVSLSAFFSTEQLLRMGEGPVRRHYMLMWIMYMSAMIISVVVIVILHLVLDACDVLFYPLEATFFAPAVTYYLIHTHMVVERIKKIKPGKEIWGHMEIYAADNDTDTAEAKRAFFRRVKDGSTSITSIAISHEKFEDFFKEHREFANSVFYVRITDRGYVVGGTVFHSIDEMSKLHPSTMDFHGIVVYVHAFPKIMQSPSFSKEKLRFYLTLQKMLRDGALFISPIQKSYIVDSEAFIETRYPVWHIKPLLILRLQECINEIHSKIESKNRNDFLSSISRLNRNGMPPMEYDGSYISLDLSSDMNSGVFKSLLDELRSIVVSEGFLSSKEFDALLRVLFRKYGEDYDAIIKIKKGLIYILSGDKAEEKSMEKAVFLSEQGRRVLILSRTNPEILRDNTVLGPEIDIKWLTNVRGDDSISPQLEAIKGEIFSFIDANPGAVVVLDGMEYLIRIHGFSSILELLWILKDRMGSTGSNMLIPMNIRILDKADVEMLKREFRFL